MENINSSTIGFKHLKGDNMNIVIVRTCQECSYSRLNSNAWEHYLKTADTGSYPKDYECDLGNEQFPCSAGTCEDFIENY
jgi:hypothetical protein